MIVTLTPNPSLDRTIHLDQLTHGEVNRAARTFAEPSGKGVNVSIALGRCEHPTRAVLPLGGPAGTELAALLDAEQLAYDAVAIAEPIRSNLSLIEADGTTTKINEPGPALVSDTVERLVSAALRGAQAGSWLAVCGSWPAGFDVETVRSLLTRARAAELFTAVDTSGDGLRALLEGSVLPDVVKPNSFELAELTGASLRTVGDVVAAGEQLLDRGIGTVLVSLGGDGAVLLTAGAAPLQGQAEVPRVVNTAGAGDAFLAGYLLAADIDAPPADRLACALRLGGSAVQAEGTLLRAIDEGLVVRIGKPDVSRPLTEPAEPPAR